MMQLLTDIKGEISCNTLLLLLLCNNNITIFYYTTIVVELNIPLHLLMITQTENQDGNTDLKWHRRHWWTQEIHIQSISSQSIQIHILFKCTWIVSRADHILGHITSLGKCKKTEITSSIFSDQNTRRLEINSQGKNCKNQTGGGYTTCY